MSKINTVGQLRKALDKFEEEDKIAIDGFDSCYEWIKNIHKDEENKLVCIETYQ